MRNACRLRRLFYCSISFRSRITRGICAFWCALAVLMAGLALPAQAADPNKTIVNEGLFGSKSGSDKKNAALSFVGAVLSLTEAVSNKEIVDEGKFKDGLAKIIDGTVQCLNASAWAK